ncbi:MAG: acyltransferase [Bacteroidales bacterium]|nr:acyltransferase [Lachnoclostridium sp.]MCM1383929.1 acyltransferase [Lachnoclostridium sp.]MCM1464638.1 acyltransferase [Bacteroidales bacterium]
MDSYLSRDELGEMSFKSIGEDVRISRRAVFYAAEKIEIGSHVRIDDFCFVSGGEGIHIGNYVHLAAYSALYGKFGIEIGDYVNISSRVSIYSTSDDYSGEFMTGPLVEQECIHDIGKKIMIEKHVIIGTGSVLLPGAILHQGVAVGAMSLVKEELQPFKIYAGVPAKYIKERSRELLEKEAACFGHFGTRLTEKCNSDKRGEIHGYK